MRSQRSLTLKGKVRADSILARSKCYTHRPDTYLQTASTISGFPLAVRRRIIHIRGMSDFPVIPSGQIHLSSDTGSARNPYASGKPFDAGKTTAPAGTGDFPPRCARNRDLLYCRYPATPSTSPQTVPGAPSYPPQSPLRGFGHAKKACPCVLRDARGPKLGENKRLPDQAYGR